MDSKKDEKQIAPKVEAQSVATPEAVPTQEAIKEEKPKKLPWAKLIAALVTSEAKEKEVEKRLRANDINTYQDLVNNPNAVISILRDVYGADYGSLLEAAKEYEDATNG